MSQRLNRLQHLKVHACNAFAVYQGIIKDSMCLQKVEIVSMFVSIMNFKWSIFIGIYSSNNLFSDLFPLSLLKQARSTAKHPDISKPSRALMLSRIYLTPYPVKFDKNRRPMFLRLGIP